MADDVLRAGRTKRWTSALKNVLLHRDANPFGRGHRQRYLANIDAPTARYDSVAYYPRIVGCSESQHMKDSDDKREWLDDKTANWIENERSSREKLRAEYAELFASVSAILFECDPIGINFDDNTDEYDAEAGSIIPRLRECSSERDARRVIHEEFTKWFSDTAGEESRYTECASKIWALWQTQQPP